KEKNIYDPSQTPFTIAINAKKYRDSILNKDSISENMTSSNDIISSDSVISLDDTTNILSKVTYPWLRLGQKEKNYALFCKLCEAAKFNYNFVTDCEYLKEQLIKRHIETQDHQKLTK
ncbi:14226_t:CDS:2, partial [Cetraspora pellucida]